MEEYYGRVHDLQLEHFIRPMRRLEAHVDNVIACIRMGRYRRLKGIRRPAFARRKL
jgi:hypothetical protein